MNAPSDVVLSREFTEDVRNALGIHSARIKCEMAFGSGTLSVGGKTIGDIASMKLTTLGINVSGMLPPCSRCGGNSLSGEIDADGKIVCGNCLAEGDS